MHSKMSETIAVPLLQLFLFWDIIKHRDFFAADQDGRDWAGVAEVRAAVRQVLIPCPARWPQPGWTYCLPAASARGQGVYEHFEVGRRDLHFLFKAQYKCAVLI